RRYLRVKHGVIVWCSGLSTGRLSSSAVIHGGEKPEEERRKFVNRTWGQRDKALRQQRSRSSLPRTTPECWMSPPDHQDSFTEDNDISQASIQSRCADSPTPLIIMICRSPLDTTKYPEQYRTRDRSRRKSLCEKTRMFPSQEHNEEEAQMYPHQEPNDEKL
ncbi:hypothetical protein RF55_13638, partial [Lasius niger]